MEPSSNGSPNQAGRAPGQLLDALQRMTYFFLVKYVALKPPPAEDKDEVETARHRRALAAWHLARTEPGRFQAALAAMLVAWCAALWALCTAAVGLPVALLLHVTTPYGTSVEVAVAAGVGLLAACWPPGERLERHAVERTRDQAPQLFAWLDGLCAELGLVPVTLVRIEPGINVVAERRVHWPWGGAQLLLGAALLDVATQEAVRALAAETLLEVSWGHDPFLAWAARVRAGHSARLAGRLAARWLAPHWQAMLAAARCLRTQHLNAWLTARGCTALGPALAHQAVLAQAGVTFMREELDFANPQPPHKHHAPRTAYVRSAWNRPLMTYWLAQARAATGKPAEGFLSAAQQLEALGLPFIPSPLPSTPAAEGLFSAEAWAAVVAESDADHRMDIARPWAMIHAGRQEELTALAELQRRGAEGPHGIVNRFRCGRLLMSLDRPAEAEAILRDIVQERPDSFGAVHDLGLALLLQDNAEGTDYLRHCIAVGGDGDRKALGVLYTYLLRDGQETAAMELALLHERLHNRPQS